MKEHVEIIGLKPKIMVPPQFALKMVALKIKCEIFLKISLERYLMVESTHVIHRLIRLDKAIPKLY